MFDHVIIIKRTMLLLIVLFMVLCIIPSASSFTSTINENILYVGGSGPGNYSSIQSAIDNASNGDTVFVYDDSSPYNESVIVNKSINIIGEDKTTTIIIGDSGLSVFIITTDWVNISGFTVTHHGWDGAGIAIYSNYNTISDNIIDDNYRGIYLEESSYNTLVRNNFSGNAEGILLLYSTYNIIAWNAFRDGCQGVILGYFSDNNLIHGNSIMEQNEDGIKIFHSDYNNISANNFSHSRDAISSVSGNYNIITGNNFERQGIGFWESSTHNEITYNTGNGVGIGLYDTSSHNKIRLNSFRDPYIGMDSSFNEITCNNFFLNRIYDDILMNMHFLGNCQNNKWEGNYWFRPRIFPKPILGYVKVGNFTIPWVNFDWHPALRPYDISLD